MSRSNEGELLHSLLLNVNRELAPLTQERLVPRRSGDNASYTLYLRRPARLTRNLYFVVRHYCAMRGAALDTTGYHYAFEDADGKEIIVYHWHPTSPVTGPHLHIGAGANAARPELSRVHLPTGQITWPDVLWSLREFTSAGVS